jgi:hypothetical protein
MRTALESQDLAPRRDPLVLLIPIPIVAALMNPLTWSDDTHLARVAVTLRETLHLQGKNETITNGVTNIILLAMHPGRLVRSPLGEFLCLDRIMSI